MGKNLGGYSDNFLKSIFTPEELEHVYKTGALARSAGLNTNPSGTATVSSAIEQTMHPGKLATQTGAAKLTTSPSFNARMMKSGRAPQGGAAGNVARAAGVAGRMQSNRDIFDDETLAQWKKDHAKL
jgi:hypothetical protein